MNLGIVVLNMEPCRSGVDAALFTLMKEWRHSVDMTLYYSRLDPRARLEGVSYVPLRAIPWYKFSVQAVSCARKWRRRVAHQGFPGPHDLIYVGHHQLMPANALTIHFCMSDYQAVRRAVGVPLAMREGGLVRWLYQELDCAIGHRLEQRSFSRLISDSGVALHAVSNSVAHAITNYYSCVKPVVIPNPVCLERYSPGLDTVLKWTWIKEKTGWADGVWRHLFVGGGWERKGLAVAIKALALGSSDSVLMVVGQGLESRYRQLADQLGVGRRVYFAGAQKDVEQWYALSNVFVFPSRYEAMPIVCIEALASGLPVLCAPFKGTEMFLREGVNGYSVSSPQEMANRSMQLRADCGIYAAMRSAAVASVVPFAAPRVAAQMLDFLKQARPRGRGNG